MSECVCKKVDIQHSKSAIFVILYSLHLHTKPAMKTETKHSSRTTLNYQQRNPTVTVHTWLAPTCVPEQRHW